MADVIVFHHALGLTPGVRGFADRLRADGHRVTLPDLYDGETFDTVAEGVAHAQRLTFDAITARGVAAAAGLPERAVYVGFSLGVLPAQRLAQTRPGALAAVLLHGAVPAAAFGAGWPVGVALRAHVNRDDGWGDVEVAGELVTGALAAGADAELALYPGSAHLFTDDSRGEYEPASADLVLTRVREFLSRWAD
ncbi:dienelactone hydrolase [Pilimelia anulata]|uniref:Dienelactone hydrolase n=1 Tax=Pilimelia anulata TaxID=53371 RepID=A0A8J3BH05_9ACTN|nr:dienelactone hydrolase family protein [Pilimelia anulata]GGK08685.1 dienelactone hydrolase [Pilimelia anulata]